MCSTTVENNTNVAKRIDSIIEHPSITQNKLIGIWRCDSIVKPELTYTTGPLLYYKGRQKHVEYTMNGDFIIYFTAGEDSIIKRHYKILGDTALRTGKKEWIDNIQSGAITKTIELLDSNKMILREVAKIVGNQFIRGTYPGDTNPPYPIYTYYTKVKRLPY
jgi:hypothetical protein